MRYPVVYPYYKLRDLAEKQEISLRKQVCLQFLKWGFTAEKKDRDEFVELLMRWRKEEGNMGSHRTLLERKGRKLFKAHGKNKRKKTIREGCSKYAKRAVKEKLGVHSPEFKKRQRENCIRACRIGHEKKLISPTKNWIIYSPDGEVFRVRGARQFCIERGLHAPNLRATHRFPGRTYKGWRAERVDDEWMNL